MPRPVAITLLAFGLVAATPLEAAEHLVTANPDNTFTPADLTIEVGDTVTWSNNGGTHNVAATDGSFRCAQGCDGSGGSGTPSSAAWSFSLTFDMPGVVDYVCELHAGIGMTGTITVQATQPEEPGSLRFTTTTLQVAENAGQGSIGVERVAGSDGAVTVVVAATAGSADAGSDFSPSSEILAWNDGDGGTRTFSVAIVDDETPEANETVNLMLSDPTGGATLGNPSAATLTILDDDEAAAENGTATFSAASYSASESSGSVAVTVRRQGGQDGAVSVDLTTSDGSASAGLDYEPVSETLQWNDGQSGARTVEVPLLDDGDEEPGETVNLALSNSSGGLAIGNPGTATLTIEDDDATVEACVADETTLCLGAGGRFRARIEWRSNQDAGDGRAVALDAEESGLFYFFSSGNVEMLLKVLDACIPVLGERHWVFFAATTTVEFDLEILDTATGMVKHYLNPLGTAALPVTDTEGFPCV